jgi:uncharacterized membrane protein YeaQ/YmgE (transglycosylase-associated protein family)
MNLVSWLLFGLVLGIISITSKSNRNAFTVIAVGINSVVFGVVLAHTIISEGILALNFMPFVIAVMSIIAFTSLGRMLRQI